ncbi:RcnB family protein [Dyella silvatica]|uniref:RcnB family protein n=1 Tax=Dyella silvatica TaxID=2992128 RepID=UPI0022519831|nr:RcnB family protein [Dyella silvatica]
MKIMPRVAVALSLLLGSGAAFADNDHRERDRYGNQRHHQRDHRDDDRRHYGYRHDNRRYDRDDRRYDGRWNNHYRPHRWARGHRYDGPNYIVRDYGYYRLRPPPRGYHWVRSDNDYLLVAIATGIILDMAIR